MNINELYEQANAHAGLTSWQCNVPADEIIELIAAYRESVAALGAMVTYARADRCGLKIADDALATAKRLGVE